MRYQDYTRYMFELMVIKLGRHKQGLVQELSNGKVRVFFW